MKSKLFLLLAVLGIVCLFPSAYSFGSPVAKIGGTEYTTLAAARLAAQSGDTIEIFGGTWGADAIGTLTTAEAASVRGKSLTIQPVEGASAKFTANVFIGYDDSKTANATVTVKNIAFENARLALVNYVQATVENCSFTGGDTVAALYISDSCDKTHLTEGDYPVDQVTVRNCTFNGTVAGASAIRLRNSGNVTITGNTIANAGHNGILIESNTAVDNSVVKTVAITGNTITEWNATNVADGGRGIRLSLAYDGGLAADSTVTITNNVFRKATLGRDLPDFAKITGGGSATVDLSGNDWNDMLLSEVNGNSAVYTSDVAATIGSVITTKSEPVAQIGTTKYKTLAAAIAAAAGMDPAVEKVIELQFVEITEGIKLPSTLKNVTFRGKSDGSSVLKNMYIISADGSGYTYENIWFDGVVFDDSYLVITGGRTGTTVNKNWKFTDNTFRNLTNHGYSYLHFASLDEKATAENFTFIGNTVNGSTFANAAALNISSVTGALEFNDNDILGLLWRPMNIQFNNHDGIADVLTVTGNTFNNNGSVPQMLTKYADGDDTLTVRLNENIFGGSNETGFVLSVKRPETLVADLTHNYFSSATKYIYFNGSVNLATAAAAYLPHAGHATFSYYTGLTEQGVIDVATLFDVLMDPLAPAGSFKVADGFYQNAATYAAATEFYITKKAGLCFFRDLVNSTPVDAFNQYASGGFTALSLANFYQQTIFSGKTVKLLADVDLNNEAWTPIGNSKKFSDGSAVDGGKPTFYGTFDGCGHKVSNLKINNVSNADKDGAGLFGRFASSAMVKNLTIENVDIYAKSYAGALCGNAGSGTPAVTIDNVNVVGNIQINGYGYVGGLVGHGLFNVTNCSVIANAGSGKIISRYWQVGGISGTSRSVSSFTDCRVKNIDIEVNYYSAGGISGNAMGNVHGCTVENLTIGAYNGSASFDASQCGTIVGCLAPASVILYVTDNMPEGAGQCGIYNNPDLSVVGWDVVYDDNGKIVGGTFEKCAAGALADGYGLVLVKPVTTPAIFTAARVLARVGDLNYLTLAEAIEAAGSGGTVTLLANDLTAELAAGQSVTIDENGHTGLYITTVGGYHVVQTGGTYSSFPNELPTEVWVDDDFALGSCDGLIWGYNAFTNIQQAVDAVVDDGTVNIAAGTYVENVYVYEKNLGIIGAGAAATIVDGNAANSVFIVEGDIDVAIMGLTIQNGAAETGGGIYAVATSYYGYGDGLLLSLVDCWLKNNTAVSSGGGLATGGLNEHVTLIGTTISGNTASGKWAGNGGGGAFIYGGSLTMQNCTVSGNTAVRDGGGIFITPNTLCEIDFVTATGNTAARGGGLSLQGAVGAINNTIVCGNTATANNNVFGAIPTPGGAHNLIDQDAKLGALADNGGPTPTHALLANSPAINGGVAGTATHDQRGVPRDQGNAPDIGAYEVVFIAYVDDDYTAESCGGHVWGLDAFATVQGGIDGVAVGGTVNVAAGVYGEQVTIAKALTVTGQDGAVLDGTGLGTTAVGVRIKSGNVTFDNVDVVSYQGSGIICGYEASTPGGLPNIRIVNCRIADIQPGSSHGFGIYVGYESEGFGNGKLSAHLDYSGLVLAGNVISNTANAGIVLQSVTGSSGTPLLVQGNLIHNCVASGIWIDCAREILVEQNEIEKNANGIFLSAGADGWYVENGSSGPKNLVVRNNLLGDNQQNGLVTCAGRTSTFEIYQNAFVGNALSHKLSSTLKAEQNWWNDATGPANAANPGGLGAAVSGNVDFSPWLGDGTDTQPGVIGFQPNLTPVYYLPAGLKFTAQPQNAALGATLSTVTVQVTNEIGEVATQFTNAVTLVIGSQPGSGVLTGTLTKFCVAGEVSFTDLAITLDGGTGFTLAASAAEPIAGVTSDFFDITNPAPVLDSMSPIFAAKGSGDLTLTLNGSGFINSSVVKWGADETVLVSTTVSANSITATVPAALLAAVGTADVKVVSPAVGGGTTGSLVFTITEAAQASEVWVDDDWTGYGNSGGKTWGYDAFGSIQSAVNGAAVGATVRVASGLYVEDIKINHNVTLLGPKANAARNTGSAIDWTSATTAGWTADDAEAAGEAVIRSAAVEADGVVDIAEDCDVTIKGFVVEARNRTDSANAHLIYADAKNTTLQTITIENNIIGPVTGAGQDGSKGRFGISFNSQSSGNNGLAGVVRGNKILGAEGNGANLFIIGQHYSPSMADYSGMLIESNDVYGANRSGIEIAGGVRGLTIRDNWIAYNGYIWNGSAYVQSAKSQATPDNILYGAGVNLIRTGTICGVTPENQNAIENLVLSGNTITKNEKSGVYVDAQQRNLSILGNEITDNGRDGIWLDEYGTYNESKIYHAAYGYIQNAVVSNNRIKGAAGVYAAIRVVGKPLDLSISDNDLSGNAVSSGVVQNDGAGQSWDYIANASGNWWGTADAAAVAALVSGDVDYSPWLAAGTDTGSGALGFKGDFSVLWVDDNSPHAGTKTRMQEATDLVASGGTVRVLAGTYAGAFTITKPVTVLGPNDGISPNTGVRVAEAVLQGTTASGLSESVALDTTGVVLRGLTFDNLRIDSYNGNEHEQITGDVIAFNRFINVLGTPIYLRDGRDVPGEYSTGVVVQDNRIESPASAGSADFNAGSGIIVMGAEALAIRDNVILSAAYNGIQLGRCNGVVLQNNTATGCVQPALQIAQWNDGEFAISGNTFSTLSTTKAAVRLYGFTNNYNPLFTFTGNTIRDSKYGVQIGHGDAGKGYNDIRDADYAFSGNTFANIESYRLLVYLATAATAEEQTEMDALFVQIHAAGTTAKAITAADPFTYVAVPNPVWVDDSFTAESCDGHIWGYDAFATIQAGVNAVVEGGTVHVAAGTYEESFTLNKQLTLTGPATGDKPLLVGMITGTYTGGLTTLIENIDFKVNATDKNNLKLVGVTNLTVKGCAFNADGRFLGDPNVVAVQLDTKKTCKDITFDGCTFHDGYYVAIQGWADNLLVKDCLIDNCKSGVNVQYACGAGATVTNCEINVVAQGAANDTYCVRFGSETGVAAPNMSIIGCTLTVDTRGLTPDEDIYFNAVIVRATASGTLALSQSSIQGGVVNLSETLLTAENNWFGSVTGPTSTLNAGGTGDAVTGTGPVDFSPWLGDGTDTQPEVIGFQPNLTPVYYLPAGIWFSTEPTGALLGAPLGTQPVITVTNEIGGVATQFNGSVTLAIGNNPGVPVAGELSGTTNLVVQGGVATFSGLAIVKGTGNGYTLVASTEGLPAVTSAFFNIENSAPVLDEIGDMTIDEEVLRTFTATATDPDLPAQTLTFSLSGEVPDGASITANGVFTWTPTEEQGGAKYTFTVVVTDNGTGELSDSETITITVNEVNVAPTISTDTEFEVDEHQTLTFTATATDPDIPAQTLTFSLSGEVPEGASITANGVFTWKPGEEHGGSSYVVDVVVTDNGEPALATTQRVTIAVNEVNSKPTLAPIPPQSVNFGQTLTFTASATDDDLPAQTLTYTMTGGVPEGATLDSSTGVFTWTPTEEQAKANYSFTITVTDSGDPVLSDEQTVTIGAISAAHSCPGYWSPSTSMVVSNTFAFGGTLTNLTWTPVLPNAGWVITAADAGGNGAVVVTNDGTAVAFTTLPTASPVVFTYTVSVPGNQAVSNSLGAVVSFNGLAAEVAPIAIFRYHSADYRRDLSGETAGQFRKIDSTEINRVLSYWRLGYKPDAAGYDGFSAASGYTGTEAAHHSADVNKNWAISLGELLPVQNYWRSGGYHVDLTTADGYAADRAGIGPSLFALAGISVAGQTAPSGYNPGETLQVTYTFDPAGASLKALGWELDLPDGWVIESVSGDAKPTFARNEIVCNAAVLPASTVTVTLTLRVPLTEIRTVTLGGTALVITDGNNAVDSYAMEAAALAPVDEDNNGMADSWERAFAGDAGTLDPDADLDGDTMSNLNEYLCGTLPNDAESVLKMVAVQTSADGTMQVSWASVAGRTYTLQRADGSPAAANFKAIQTGIAADPSGRNVYIDRDVDGPQARFYRVVLEE